MERATGTFPQFSTTSAPQNSIELRASLKPVDRIYWVIRMASRVVVRNLVPSFSFSRCPYRYNVSLVSDQPLGNDPRARSRFVDRELIETWKDRSIFCRKKKKMEHVVNRLSFRLERIENHSEQGSTDR